MSKSKLRHGIKRIVNRTKEPTDGGTVAQHPPRMTLYEKLSLGISFLGVISLGFIFMQTRAIQQQNAQGTVNMQASMYATIANLTLALDKVFSDNPQLRPYFYGGKNVAPGEGTYELVISTAEYELDVFDAIQTQLDYIPDEPDKQADRDTWDAYFARSFRTSPPLCARIKANPDWYMDRLNKLAKDNCQ